MYCMWEIKNATTNNYSTFVGLDDSRNKQEYNTLKDRVQPSTPTTLQE